MKYSVMGEGRNAEICMKVYAFDVDETLYLSHGPVQWETLVALRAEGHVLGLCGNWAAVTLQVPEWHRVLSFIGPGLIGTDKETFLPRSSNTFRRRSM